MSRINFHAVTTEALLTEQEAEHLVRKHWSERRLPSVAFVHDRHAARQRRRAAGKSIGDLSFAELWAEFPPPIMGGATNFTVTLDTTAPAGVSISINAGAATTNTQAVTATIGTSDGDTTGYQMKVWGNVDNAADPNIQTTEGASAWVTYSTSQAVTLSSGDGSKTLNVKVRDDVWNESSAASDSITLDTTAAVPNITTAPDATRISKISGKRTVNFGWQADTIFDEYKIKVVPATNSIHTAGTVIPTTNGSTNVAGTAGGYPATTTISSSVDGRDLELASSGDGDKIIKIFVKDAGGNWST